MLTKTLVKHAELTGDLLTRSGIGKKADRLKYATNLNQMNRCVNKLKGKTKQRQKIDAWSSST